MPVRALCLARRRGGGSRLVSAARLASTAALLGAFAACGGELPEPEPPPYVSSPRPKPRAKAVEAPDWGAFPEAPHGAEALQVTHDELLRALVKLRNQCVDDPTSRERRASVRAALAPVLPLVARSFADANPHVEVSQLASAVARQLEAAKLPVVDVPTALLWLASEGLDAAVCADASDAIRWPSAILAWATSTEAIYQTAFAVFGAPFARVIMPPTADPWESQGRAVAEVARRMLSIGAKPGAPGVLRGLKLSAATGVVAVGAVGGSDSGMAGHNNGRVDPGEVIELAVEVRPAGADGLLSESIVPKSVPSCMAVGWKEIVVPEVKAGESAVVTLPRIVVSGRCGAKELLVLEVASTSSPARATWTVELSLAPTDLRLEPPVVDADMPGHSDDGDPALGILGGRRIELRPVARATGALEAIVTNAAFVLPEDAALVSIGPFSAFGLKPRPDGALLAEDDLDLTPVASKLLRSGLDARSSTNALALDPSAMWLVLDLDAELPAAPAGLAPAAGATVADKLTPKAKLMKLLRGKAKPVAVTATPGSRSEGNAGSFLARLVPPGKSAASVRPAVVGLLRSRSEIVRAALVSAALIDPPVPPVVGAFGSLASYRVLAPTVVHNVYDYLDRHQGARLRDPEARRLSRQILLVAAFLEGLPDDVARATLERIDLQALDTATPLPALCAALAPVALASQLGITTPIADGPGLRALVADLTATAEAPEAPPRPPLDSYRFRRFLRVGVARRAGDGEK